ncbi:Prolyl-tRNA editing protein ProX [Streptococcus intermedius]|uniref:prolyl-tRNA synthetase associated domain-containing protein n=1 Tax=Streptococcus intermedius TaxID=1338 RepID=UPI000F65E823|nr:prolyl-tRNA synthetase associated domain-containing protein [Streptococcus intermedius]RSJ11422.1 Prolyl-tRNA editing protein ProX [Streptococcus intermedius]RSJ17541.1 Prolyl-tRNA editing protein ProX [Streptococcus intermedius]RSJ32716.1 Prolyl-tRNA editing protein ProX [Streptococcus intermedius]
MDLYKKVEETLNKLNIPFEIVEHEPALTTEQADSFIEGIEGVRTKTMFLTNKKKTAYYLLIMDDKKRLDMDLFKELVGANKIRMASSSSDSLFEKMMLPAGVVSPFGLLNNVDKDIQVYFDKEIMSEKRMSFHPNTNEKTLFLDTTNLLKFLEAIGYEPHIIEL